MSSQTPGRLQWRSLRVQVLLWTALPLTILLIAVSLTGIGTHQSSMRSLASEETQRLTGAVATGIAQQLGSYQVGLEAAAHLIAHHAGDSAMRDFHLDETSAVLGNVELVLVDAAGRPVAASGAVEPAWVDALPALVDDPGAVFRDKPDILVRARLPEAQGALFAAVPLDSLAFASYLGDSPDLFGTRLELLDGSGAPMLTIGGAPSDVNASDAVAHDSHTPVGAVDESLVVAVAPVPGTPWSVHMVEAWHARTAPLFRFEQAMPFVILVAAAVSFLTLFFGLRFVVQPLRALATLAQRIGEGDFDAASKPVGGVNEIENVRVAMVQMAEQIRAHQRTLEQHLHAVTRAQEDERARLARELHDETVQGLIALDHRLQRAQRTLQRVPESLKAEIAELRQMTRSEMDEVRRFSRALRPTYLEDLGLWPALELLGGEMGVVCSMSGEQRRLDPAVELALYRIAQESINNARRHAQAQSISLTLIFGQTSVTLQVLDDGSGFSPSIHMASLTREGHFGVMGMQERADLIGATLAIESSPGRGTSVTVSMAV
jgi:signal transduction histidine kinase